MSEKLTYKIYLDSTKRREKEVYLVKISTSGEETETTAKKSGDIDLVATIKEILDENNLKISDISEVIPNKGPGSFTGLKIGVTIANIINWSLGRKTIRELDLPDYGRPPNITPRKSKKK